MINKETIMKKILMGCMTAVAVLIALASCAQDFTT